ncbi:hypothetical protein PMAYCL1PPCAC_27830, partial [Pristionchus mayeri]
IQDNTTVASSKAIVDHAEIKDEPVDEFADIKQEEPILDMYCPSTGTSRPHDKTNIGTSAGTVDIATAKRSKKRTYNRYCVMCEEKTSSFILTPIDPSKAKQFCDNIIDVILSFLIFLVFSEYEK